MCNRQNENYRVKLILPICKTKAGTFGKLRKTLRPSRSVSPSINNLKRFTLSGILLEVRIIKKHENACATETPLRKHCND